MGPAGVGMLRALRGWPTPAPILAAAAAVDFGVVTYMIVRRLHPPPPGSRAPPQVTRRMAAAVLGRDPGTARSVCVSAPPASSATVTAGQRAQVEPPGERTRKAALDLGASADTPVRRQGPGGRLPGPGDGHPLQVAGGAGTGSTVKA